MAPKKKGGTGKKKEKKDLVMKMLMMLNAILSFRLKLNRFRCDLLARLKFRIELLVLSESFEKEISSYSMQLKKTKNELMTLCLI